MTIQLLKSITRKAIPSSLYRTLRRVVTKYRISKVRKSLKKAVLSSDWLEEKMIPTLQELYPHFKTQEYDIESLKKRGREQAEMILSMSRKHKIVAHSFLEIGCGSGQVSTALKERETQVVGVDLITEDYDPETRRTGFHFIQSDATKLPFRKDRFDFIFSFDSFEHLSNPEESLREMISVLAPGGHIYLRFGPLYGSPFGLHAYHSLPIPYLQYLFTKEVLDKAVTDQNLPPINWSQVNKWTLRQFRDLWKINRDTLNIILYKEYNQDMHLDLVDKYPSCFKGKIEGAEDLTISSIEVLFQKREALPGESS